MASLVPPPADAGAVAASSTELAPGGRLSVAENVPVGSAVTVVIEVDGALAPGAVDVTAKSTVAPGAVVPVTGTDAASTVALGRVRCIGTSPPTAVSGAVTLSGTVDGPPPAYRLARIDGC